MVLRKGLTAALAVVATFVLATAGQAATITFDGEEARTGTGLGSVLTVLTIQETPDEEGAVEWSGSADIITGDAKTGASQTTTRTVSELLAVDADGDLALIVNVSETGNDAGVTLEDLTATFYGADGSVLFTASTDQDYQLGINSGIGSAGWLFEVDLTDEEINQFFSDDDNRLGLAATITGSVAGPETIFVADLGGVEIIPIPAAVWLGLAGLGMVMARRRFAA